jgi:hypothetical protein
MREPKLVQGFRGNFNPEDCWKLAGDNIPGRRAI